MTKAELKQARELQQSEQRHKGHEEVKEIYIIKLFAKISKIYICMFIC